MNRTIRARIHESAVKRVTRIYAATLADIFTETLQNSRRADAARVRISVSPSRGHPAEGPADTGGTPLTVTVSDDGGGIADPAVLLSFGENGWERELVRREDAAGFGFASLARRNCIVSSRPHSSAAEVSPGWRVQLAPAHFLGEAGADVQADDEAPYPWGTSISFEATEAIAAIRNAAENAARHFPLPVIFEDRTDGDTASPEELPRRAFLDGAAHAEPWRGLVFGVFRSRRSGYNDPDLNFFGLNLKEDLPPMPRFLNRLLALPIAEQNQLFAELEKRIAANIEQAIEAGSYEVGVETVTADSLVIAGRETLYEHPGTGAATELVEIVRRDRLVPLTADAALEIGERDPGPDGKPRLAVNARSKRAAVVLPAASRMLDDGGVKERVRLVRPATAETMARAELDASNWRRADEAGWRRVWDAEIAGLPSHRDSRFWLASGLLLPVWDRLPAENMRVRRLTSDDGISLIGRVLDAEQVRSVRAGFGLDGGPAMSGAEAFAAVMERGNALSLANGWRLARRRLMGRNRIELEGPADTDLPALRRMGCTVEIVSFRARIFAPNAGVLERILDRWPLAA